MRRQDWKRAAKTLAVLAIVLFVQTTFGNDLRVDRTAPDLMLLMAVSAGFAAGPDEGALAGFVAGLAADLFLQSTPFGLSALAYCLAGFVVGWARANFMRQRWSLAPFAASAGTATGTALFVVIGYVVGAQQLVAPGKRWLVELVFVESVWAAVFSLPAVALMAWALRRSSVTSATLTTTVTSGVIELPTRRRPPLGRSRRRRRPRARVR